MRAFVIRLFILLGFISTVTAGTLPQTAHYISAGGLSDCQKVGQICNVGLVTSTGLVLYSVSDPTVCTVSGSGIVTVIGGGLCVIGVEMLGDATYAYSAGTLAMGVMIGVSPAVAISPDSKDTSNSAKSNSQAAGTNANAPGMCPAANSASRDPVDLATGYFYETLNLLDVVAAGAPLQFNLSYSSGYPAAGSSGFGWGHHYQYGLVDLTTSINISWPDRHVSSYTANG